MGKKESEGKGEVLPEMEGKEKKGKEIAEEKGKETAMLSSSDSS